MKQAYFYFESLVKVSSLEFIKMAFLICFSYTTYGQTTVYVNSTSGDDTTGNGTLGSPYQSFHKGYTETLSGDIFDLTGTFDWTNADESGDSAISGYTISKNLTIQGQGASTTFIQAASTENSADRRVFTATNSAIFDALTISGITIRYGVSTANDNTSAGLLILTTTSHYDFVLNVNNCSFDENNITSFPSGNGFSGAALAFSGYAYGTLVINQTTFKDNSAYIRSYGSGAIYINQSANATLTSCTFDGNTGRSNFSGNYYGTSGALYAYRHSIVKITNCTFSNNNSDGNGGAIILHQNTTYLTNNSIVGNTVTSASGKGGGILINDQTNTYLKNKLIANNVVNGVSNDFYSELSSSTSNGYNIVESSTGYTFNSSGDIIGNQTNLFGTGISTTPALAENNSMNGVQTVALSEGSIAIDAGNNTVNSIVAVPSNDQREAARIGNTDIGSFEYGGVLSVDEILLSSIKMFPTITSGIININDDNTYQFCVYNMLGQEIESGKVRRKMDISKHAKGLYLIKLRPENLERTFKIVLE
jgi:hypothetical protein